MAIMVATRKSLIYINLNGDILTSFDVYNFALRAFATLREIKNDTV